MITKIWVGLGNRSYPIYVGKGILESVGHKLGAKLVGRYALLVTNTTVSKLYGQKVKESLESAGFEVLLAEIPDGEEYKTLDTASTLYDQAFMGSLDRNCPVIALGGGVVGDLAGFVASTYLRGVPFVQLPTTLLAQVDSSVGGKVAVNHPLGKNIIGSFYQPQLVVADVQALQTLPIREIRTGLAEVIKYGIIMDSQFFIWLENNLDRLLTQDSASFQYAVELSCRAKAHIVEKDETEQGWRQILNFGHTFGHAIETLTNYKRYTHGEAVAIGMVAATRLARSLGKLVQEDYQRIEGLIQRSGLPVEIPRDLSLDAIINSMLKDKKTRAGKVTLILPDTIGKVSIVTDLSPEYLSQVL